MSETVEEKAKRYFEYLEIALENGVIDCSDCDFPLSVDELKDNYSEPLCNDCIRALKN